MINETVVVTDHDNQPKNGHHPKGLRELQSFSEHDRILPSVNYELCYYETAVVNTAKVRREVNKEEEQATFDDLKESSAQSLEKPDLSQVYILDMDASLWVVDAILAKIKKRT